VNAGFIDSGTSAVMIAESSRLSREPVLPEGTELLRVSDEAGVDLLIEVHESVFGHSHEELRRSILRRLDVPPQETDMFVVMAGRMFFDDDDAWMSRFRAHAAASTLAAPGALRQAVSISRNVGRT